MSEKDVEAIIRKAVQDDTFRLALGRDLDKAVESHQLELTDEEREALRNVDWDSPIPTGRDMKLAATWIHIYKTNLA